MVVLSGNSVCGRSLQACGLEGTRVPGDASTASSPPADLRAFCISAGLQPHSGRYQGRSHAARKKRGRSQIQALTDRLSTWSPRLGENEYPRYLKPIGLPEGGKGRTYG